MLSEDAISKLIRAGDIAKRALQYTSRLVKPGLTMFDIANGIEQYIKEIGGQLAFPVNIGVNHVAAHYTPTPGDKLVIPDNSVVKIDIGVHVDGYIADTAITISFNPIYEGLIDATRKALEKTIEIIKPGIRASEIGKVIEETIKSHGYKPVKNLSGHGIDRYVIHSGVIIPNYNDYLNIHRLDPGIYAIEPFATNGAGLVEESNLVTIYALKPCKKIPLEASSIYNRIYNERKTLPFALRWYTLEIEGQGLVSRYINALLRSRCLVEYPVLVEREKGVVAQFEHTFVLTRKEVIFITL
ncbi:MAG: type II methionyl aminopeptidase [Desulfurococcaceae archaeon]